VDRVSASGAEERSSSLRGGAKKDPSLGGFFVYLSSGIKLNRALQKDYSHHLPTTVPIQLHSADE
jgi:hypothetical protein